MLDVPKSSQLDEPPPPRHRPASRDRLPTSDAAANTNDTPGANGEHVRDGDA